MRLGGVLRAAEATTLAGLIQNNSNQVEIIGIPVLKGLNDINERLSYLNNQSIPISPTIFHNYHFGGYAKYDEYLEAYVFFTLLS